MSFILGFWTEKVKIKTICYPKKPNWGGWGGIVSNVLGSQLGKLATQFTLTHLSACVTEYIP